ncbi:alpha/beta hydrolase [Mastigocoleus testarum]|uniref:alpha/beta hydrolase n=1 Tax=Mastigocoleus testarum TaxID=996925 RepID=UPI00071B3714|nr:hypothetical protein [Mastigocoleus testarum]
MVLILHSLQLFLVPFAQDPLGLFTGKLDLDRVGIFGYSLGGAIAAQTLLEDDRFKAGINLDGGLYIDGVDESLNKPFMFMNNEAFGTGNPSDPLVKAQQSFFENLQDDGYELTIRGSNHSNFSDLPLVLKELQDAGLLSGESENSIADNSNPINPKRATQIINDYTVAFFDQYLNNQESPLLEASSSPYPEVIFDFREGDNVSSNPEPIFGTVGKDVIEVEGNNKIVFAGKGDDLIDASQGNGDNHRIYAGEGNDTLIMGADSRVFGQEGDDRFFVTSGGDNIISGGAGADQFWIAVAQTPDTTNAIADFTNGEDIIGIAGLGIGFEDLTITQQGNNTLIASNGTDLAILQGINANDLSADNFAFV